MSEKKTLEFGFICGGRRSQNTYNSLVTMYQYAKENGYIDINVNFIEPELEKYKEVIEEVREYVNYLHNNCKYRLNDGHLRKLKKILDKAGDINEKKN